MLESILLILSPIAVTIVSQVVKVVMDYGMGMANQGGFRLLVLRFIVALLSLGSVVGTSILSGQDVDVASIQTFAEAVMVFLGASGAYFLAKRKNNQ